MDADAAPVEQPLDDLGSYLHGLLDPDLVNF